MAPRPEPPAAVLAAPLPVVANSAPAIVETVAPPAIAPLTLCHAQPVVENRTVVLIDPMSTGVILQKRVFSLGYRIILVWSDRTQPASHEKHFERSGFSKEDFAAVIVHEAESGIEDTVASILAVATDIAAVMCGSEHGVLLEDAIAQGLRKALAASHINGSGLAQTTLKVDKHAQANIIRSAGLAAVHELLAYTEEDVHKFLETASDSDSFVVKPQTGAGSVGVTFCSSKQSVLDAFRKIIAGEHKAHYKSKYRHYERAGVLLQEYLKGTEYIVNSVVKNGEIKTTAMFRYGKFSICFRSDFTGMDGISRS